MPDLAAVEEGSASSDDSASDAALEEGTASRSSRAKKTKKMKKVGTMSLSCHGSQPLLDRCIAPGH